MRTSLYESLAWFAEPPKPLLVNVIAASRKDKKHFNEKNAGVSTALRVLLHAKPEKVRSIKCKVISRAPLLISLKYNQADELRAFLKSAVPLVEAEPQTIYWIACEVPGANIFGIFDCFANEEGRNAHLNGKVAEALFAKAPELLSGEPDIAKSTILAAHAKD